MILSAGKPEDTKIELRNGCTIEKWYYGKFENRLGNIKYEQEVRIKNGHVDGWKDIEQKVKNLPKTFLKSLIVIFMNTKLNTQIHQQTGMTTIRKAQQMDYLKAHQTLKK